jgi:hypothetical protein
MLDGSSARLKNTDVLESAEGHSITFLCVPSHAAQALETLGCAFLKVFVDCLKKCPTLSQGEGDIRIEAEMLTGQPVRKLHQLN